jgi:aminopeptidase-like protein
VNSCLFVSDLKPSDCAAWVQAWGTVLAVVASLVLVWVQHRLQQIREEHLRKRQLVARMRTIQEIAESTVTNMRFLLETFTTRQQVHDVADGRTAFPSEALDQISEAVETIPLHELDSPALVFNVRVLVIVSRTLRSRLQWMLAHHRELSGGDFADGFNDFRDLADQGHNAFTRIKSHVDEVERTGRVPIEFERGSGTARKDGAT